MITQKIIREFGQAGIELTTAQGQAFETYFSMLCDWNQRMNLTAITALDEVIEKHFIDSLLLWQHGSTLGIHTLADVGSGAGFPGVPIKIMAPEISLTVIESAGKRISFLEALGEALSLDMTLVKCRAEDAGRQQDYRAKFDLVTARAVAPLGLLSEYCLPLVRRGGYFAAMKGPSAGEELQQAKTAIEKLGGSCVKTEVHQLPGGACRKLLWIEKCRETPEQYPRNGGVIKKKPL